jgi:hypothetical protein
VADGGGAQQVTRRVGMLFTAAESDLSAQERIGEFRKSLKDFGWIDGTGATGRNEHDSHRVRWGADAVAEGLVASLGRPGGNVTGFSNNSPSIATKWMADGGGTRNERRD